MKQKDIFLESEADAWLERNSALLGDRALPGSDPLLMEVLELPAESRVAGTKVLEIGCSNGTRLNWLKRERGFDCYGIEPSANAVAVANARGLAVQRGTADRLPFEDASFDIVMFGFCLYLCDRDDLFRIAAEADRVLRNPGWLLILDFHSASAQQRAYHHRPGLFSYKMDYRTLFTWNPAYASFSHKVRDHYATGYIDDPQEWVATSVLRKNQPRNP